MRILSNVERYALDLSDDEIVIETDCNGETKNWFLAPFVSDGGEIGLKISLDGESVTIRAGSSNCVYVSSEVTPKEPK